MNPEKKPEDTLYIVGWCVIVCLAGLLLLCRLCAPRGGWRQIPCLFYSVTGYYCPGCGGTRAVKALFSLRLLDSVKYHPLVPYTAFVGGWFMASQTIERVTHGRIRIGMHYHDGYLWIAAALLILHFIAINLFPVF